MGMDVIGKAATCEAGEYFRASIWSWRPIHALTAQLAPDWLMAKCKHWTTNDGDGLNAQDSRALAAILAEADRCGKVESAIRDWDAKLNALPDEECEVCGGTGRRTKPPVTGPGDIPCNGCGGDHHKDKPGTGKRRPWATYYRLDLEHFREWIRFLETCGGFAIH